MLKDPFESKLPKSSGELIVYCKFLQGISGSVPHTPSPPLSAVQRDICRALGSTSLVPAELCAGTQQECFHMHRDMEY